MAKDNIIRLSEKDSRKQDQDDYDRSIHSNPDAQAWAKLFMESKAKNNWTMEQIDESLMIGWFANAMMAMHDHIYQTKSVTEKKS